MAPTFISLSKIMFFYIIWGFLTITYSLFSLMVCWCPWQQRIPMIMHWNTVSLWLFKVLLKIDYRVCFSASDSLQHHQKITSIHENFKKLPQNIIVVSNHQSLWETIAFTPLLGRYFAFAFKKELLNIPFFGWTLRLLRMIRIDRQKGSDTFTYLVAQTQIRLTENRPILMFPQATRIPYGIAITDKKYKPFKTGAARLAFKLNVPILAIHHNAGKLWPKKGKLQSGVVDIVVGPLFYPNNYENYQDFHHAFCDWLIEKDNIVANYCE